VGLGEEGALKLNMMVFKVGFLKDDVRACASGSPLRKHMAVTQAHEIRKALIDLAGPPESLPQVEAGLNSVHVFGSSKNLQYLGPEVNYVGSVRALLAGKMFVAYVCYNDVHTYLQSKSGSQEDLPLTKVRQALSNLDTIELAMMGSCGVKFFHAILEAPCVIHVPLGYIAMERPLNGPAFGVQTCFVNYLEKPAASFIKLCAMTRLVPAAADGKNKGLAALKQVVDALEAAASMQRKSQPPAAAIVDPTAVIAAETSSAAAVAAVEGIDAKCEAAAAVKEDVAVPTAEALSTEKKDVAVPTAVAAVAADESTGDQKETVLNGTAAAEASAVDPAANPKPETTAKSDAKRAPSPSSVTAVAKKGKKVK
jgi:hypothetical protein